MAIIMYLQQRGRHGIRGDGANPRPTGFAAPLLMVFLLIVAPATGLPQAGGEISSILPVSLGEPEGCMYSNGRKLNDGSYPASLIVVGDVACPGTDGLPYLWQNNQWAPLPLPDGGYSFGYAESVSENLGDAPAFTVSLLNSGGWESWVVGPDSAMSRLVVPEGSSQVGNAVISADGNYVVGTSHYSQAPSRPEASSIASTDRPSRFRLPSI